MMHDRAWRALGAASLYSLLVACAAFIACAGGETPATDEELRDQITAIYIDGEGAVGRAGNSGSGGRSGAGGSAQAEAGSSGDDGGSGGSGGSGANGVCDGFAILALKCGSSACHGEDSQFSNFAESEDAALAYVDESGEALCASAGPLIDPANPAASILLQKVTASSPPCGSPMPVGGDRLPQEDITCLQEWIGSL